MLKFVKYRIFQFLILTVFFACNSDTIKEGNIVDQVNFDQKVDSILSIMTLKEKVGQLNQYSVGAELTGPGEKNATDQNRIEQLKNGDVGSVLNLRGVENALNMQKMVVENSRLGIPLIFAFDVIHGYKTIFPIPLAESSSWDLELMELSAKIAAKESAASGLQWTFAPMVDVSRDPRWGRVMEGAGEDTYLGSQIAVARINGFQGTDLGNEFTIAACAKHFAGYGFVESGKEYNNVNVGKNTLNNVIMPPFKASVSAGVATFMNAFNDIDGIPATGNVQILRNTLKGAWNYKGVVVSDWNSIGEMISHGVATDNKEAAKLAIEAGCDIDMEGSVYISQLEKLVASGEVDESYLDDAVRRVLKLKFDLGLFSDPYRYFDLDREKNTVLHESHLEIAEDIAKKSIVLLKNDNDLLPLKKQSIALIGPLAKDKDSPLGSWRGAGESNSAISLYEGLNDRLGYEVSYAEGCKLSIGPNSFLKELVIEETDKSGFEEAIDLAKKSEVVIMALGETAFMSGEARSRSDIDLPGLQLELLKEIYKVNKKIVLVLMNGRPLTLTWEVENIPAIIEAWHLGSRAGYAIADVLLGNYNPSGKLTMSFPRATGQIPVFYNHKNTGRVTAAPGDGEVFYSHYIDVKNDPLYPFGYGLSYSSFLYGDIKLSDNTLVGDKDITAKILVSNTSDIDGEEVVQLYIQDVKGSITRPIKELKGFKKVLIPANKTVEVIFNVNKEDLKFYNNDNLFVNESGEYNLYIGSNSRDLKSAEFQLK